MCLDKLPRDHNENGFCIYVKSQINAHPPGRNKQKSISCKWPLGIRQSNFKQKWAINVSAPATKRPTGCGNNYCRHWRRMDLAASPVFPPQIFTHKMRWEISQGRTFIFGIYYTKFMLRNISRNYLSFSRSQPCADTESKPMLWPNGLPFNRRSNIHCYHCFRIAIGINIFIDQYYSVLPPMWNWFV